MSKLTTQNSSSLVWSTLDYLDDPVIDELYNYFGLDICTIQPTRIDTLVVWIKRERILDVLTFLHELSKPYILLYDLHGIDERLRIHRQDLPITDFTVFYHLISIDKKQ